MSRRFDRRELLTAGLGLWALPRMVIAAAGSGEPGASDDLPGVGDWVRRALSALDEPGRRFAAHGEGAACDLGAVGRIEVAPAGDAALRVTLAGRPGELEILRPLATPRVARVDSRLVNPGAAPAGSCFDRLRRIPGGFELTFASSLALRHAAPRQVAGEPPAEYERLAAAALDGARSLLG